MHFFVLTTVLSSCLGQLLRTVVRTKKSLEESTRSQRAHLLVEIWSEGAISLGPRSRTQPMVPRPDQAWAVQLVPAHPCRQRHVWHLRLHRICVERPSACARRRGLRVSALASRVQGAERCRPHEDWGGQPRGSAVGIWRPCADCLFWPQGCGVAQERGAYT